MGKVKEVTFTLYAGFDKITIEYEYDELYSCPLWRVVRGSVVLFQLFPDGSAIDRDGKIHHGSIRKVKVSGSKGATEASDAEDTIRRLRGSEDGGEGAA